MNILVVDDDAAVLDALCDMVTRIGHAPTPCQNPKQALCDFREAVSIGQPFKLVMTDFNMPVWSGLTLALQIKGCCHAYEVFCPIICITGNPEDVRSLNVRDGSPIQLIMCKGNFGWEDLGIAIKQLTSN